MSSMRERSANEWIDLGGVEFKVISGGRFWLDGGGMFGIIPRVLWQPFHAPDDRNRIELDTNCLVVRTADGIALVESGNGDKLDAKERDIFSLDPHVSLLSSLGAEGVAAEDVSTVILTHLHMDHAGGCSRRGPDGVPIDLFPHAQYYVQKGEWDDAVANRSTMRVSYRAENLEALRSSGRLRLFQGDNTISSNLRVERAPGHTPHHQVVFVTGARGCALFTGDVLPTWTHLRGPYNMAYDLEPYVNMQTKARLLSVASERGWYVIPSHDPHQRVGRVRETRPGIHALESLSPE